MGVFPVFKISLVDAMSFFNGSVSLADVFFISSLTALVAVDVDVKHSPLRRQISFLWQSCPSDVVLGFKRLLLLDEITKLIFFMQL